MPDLGGRRGANVVPTVHASDLGAMVYATATTPPEQHYFFAVDKSADSLRGLVTAVSQRLSWGRVRDLTPEETDDWCLEDEQRAALLSADLRIDREEGVLDSGALDVDWVAQVSALKCCAYIHPVMPRAHTLTRALPPCCLPPQNGLKAASRRVAQEYVDTFNLHPLRVALLGPPGAGKTTLAKRLAQRYHLPLVTAKEALEEAVGDEDNKLGIKAKGEMASAKDKRVSEATMGLVLRAKLLQPPCQNQGFVLDGFPRTWAEARAAFCACRRSLCVVSCGAV